MDKTTLQRVALLHPSEITQPYDEMVELCGFEAVHAFAEIYGGQTLYVPTMRGIFAGCLTEAARKEFNGYNIKELSRKYGFTARQLSRRLGL
jgi:Mor family transcriptional regulator